MKMIEYTLMIGWLLDLIYKQHIEDITRQRIGNKIK